MKKSVFGFLLVSLFVGHLSHAKWIDPEEEAKKNHQLKAWQGVDYTFTGISAAGGTSAITYRDAVNDFWEWDAGTGIDSLGWFLTGGGDYFIYNSPNSNCFFAFSCHSQVTGGANLYYANGGRKTYTNGNIESDYDQGSSLYIFPAIGFRTIYRDFFSLGLDVGYRVMLQNPSITRSLGPLVQSNVDEMQKSSQNGLGASVSLGIVF